MLPVVERFSDVEQAGVTGELAVTNRTTGQLPVLENSLMRDLLQNFLWMQDTQTLETVD